MRTDIVTKCRDKDLGVSGCHSDMHTVILCYTIFKCFVNRELHVSAWSDHQVPFNCTQVPAI